MLPTPRRSFERAQRSKFSSFSAAAAASLHLLALASTVVPSTPFHLHHTVPNSPSSFRLAMSAAPPTPQPKAEAPFDNVFKKIIRRETKARIVYEDDEIMAFWDRSPAARLHLQIIPKMDPVPRDVCSLTQSHVPLVLRMREVAEQTLSKEGYTIDQALLGFHVPPWISVPHLHMHVIAPRTQIFSTRMLKYSTNGGWFITVDQAIKDLQRKESVQEWSFWCPFKL